MEYMFGEQRIKKGAARTKMLWTLGPASRSVEMIEKLLEAGMNVARFDFSQGSHAYHQETLNNLRAAIRNTRILCAVMLDTKGPEIRTGFLKEGKPIELTQGQEITISVDYTIQGDSNIISMSYNKLADVLKPGGVILCSDGLISLTVLSCDKHLGLVRCRCENSAVLGEGEIVNLPGVVIDLTTLTQKDKADILQWGIPNKINIIALSSVRKGSDLDEVRAFLGVHAKTIMLMSKFDNEEAVANVDGIMDKTDVVMLARSNSIITEKANALGKPIVTVVQILNGQTNDDLTNAVLNCTTDCVMLADDYEEAHPDTALQRISSLCKELENSIDYKAVQLKIKNALPIRLFPFDRKATHASWNKEAKAIIIVAKTATEVVAKLRPSVPVLLVVRTSVWVTAESSAHVASHGLVSRGVIPLMRTEDWKSIEDMISFAIKVAKKEGICNAGDKLVALRILNGYPALLTLRVP